MVRVVLPLPLDQAYTYHVPAAFEGDVPLGSRVLVPFGARKLTGMVVEKTEHTPEGKLKPILDVLDDTPSFTAEMLRLTKWMAEYYVCGWGEVVRAALPTGIDIESQLHIFRNEQAEKTCRINKKAQVILSYLNSDKATTVSVLRQRVENVSLSLLRRMETDGLIRLEKYIRRPQVSIKHERYVRFVPQYRDQRNLSHLKDLLRGPKQIAVVEAIAAFEADGLISPKLAGVLARAKAPMSTIKSLVKKGYVEIFEKEVMRSTLGDIPLRSEPPPIRTLHEAQQSALDALNRTVSLETYAAFLLHGVTGSGKTEVYIEALKSVLAKGKTGIILVPEIALTPQTVARFRAHFGDEIAVLHSRMSMGERYDAWRNLRNGRYSIVIGPRSAVLAPLSNIGLIVVDEEHEPSYKQFDPAPRYHARDVAVVRAQQNDAVCVLGSATPSLESYMNVFRGKYTLLEMPDRVPVPGYAAAPLPEIFVVDLTLEKKKHRLEGALSVPLQEAIQQRLDRREQVILLQNRRGFAPIIECQSCGWTPHCDDCSVTMTFHKAKRQLRCHYCGLTHHTPAVCPECGLGDFDLLGAGTQRVEEELRQYFPEAGILRMDLDTTSRKNAHHIILDRFGRGEADILLGTQMVAKGLDFERVTLVGVINADMGLLLPDFRAEERTFQLLTQVAGRAGRARLRGEVFLQTRNPKNSVITFALRHDYKGFLDLLLSERQLLHYPPFGRIVGIEFRGPIEERVERVAIEWTGIFRRIKQDVQILGPEPAFIGRVKRQYRYHTILKARRGSQKTFDLQTMIRRTASQYGAPPKGYHIAIDVDPFGLF